MSLTSLKVFIGLIILYCSYMYFIAFFADKIEKGAVLLITVVFIVINYFVINIEKKTKPILLGILLTLLFSYCWINFKFYEAEFFLIFFKDISKLDGIAPIAFIYMLFNLIIALLMISYKTPKKEKEIIDSFYENKESLSCPISIKGDEKLDVEPVGKIGTYLMIVLNLLLIVFAVITIFKGKFEFENMLLLWFITNAIVYFCLRLFYAFTPSYFRRCKEVEVIHEYFKRSFDLLNEFNHKEHTKLGVFDKKSDINIEHAMFDIYMEAYKLNADAIVLNDSNISTHVSSDRFRGVTSSSKHHITGTVIKYKY